MKINKKLENSNDSAKSGFKIGAKFWLAALTAIVACFVFSGHKNDMTGSSVAVTNMAGTSGGTGIVLDSDDTSSTILTNAHVCHVVEHGGMVSGPAGAFMVASYKHSQTYDLCLIKVDGNLKAKTDVAQRAPKPYYEKASVSGHPSLYPNVITTGHFSGRRVIPVMKGMTPCTDDQKNNPDTALICLLVGGFPQIMQYDSTLVTATIMPGSSGSGVYNKDNELSGVVFAGSGDLGYAWTMPYEAMRNFLDKEQYTLNFESPNNLIDLSTDSTQGKKNNEEVMVKKLKEVCLGENKEKLKNYCDLVGQDMIWRK